MTPPPAASSSPTDAEPDLHLSGRGRGLIGSNAFLSERDTQITEAPRPRAAPFRQESLLAAWGTVEADEAVSAEPRTDCIGPRIIRLEGHAAGIALEPYSATRVKHLATSRELYSIYRQAGERFFVRRTFDSFLERRAPGGRDHRGSEEPLKAEPAVCVDPDRGPIVHPGTMTRANQDRGFPPAR
jgi:hypothetical protein